MQSSIACLEVTSIYDMACPGVPGSDSDEVAEVIVAVDEIERNAARICPLLHSIAGHSQDVGRTLLLAGQ